MRKAHGTQARPGERRGNYVLLEQLGEGGMGVVFKAVHSFFKDRVVALKEIKAEIGLATGESSGRFLEEIETLNDIGEHPNIVSMLDAGVTEDGRMWYAMPLLEGTSLADHLSKHAPLPFAEAAYIAGEICRGLAAAHRCGVVHRDLKPANVFLTTGEPPGVVVLDFGASKLVDRSQRRRKVKSTEPGRVIGTVTYMSPQQLSTTGLDFTTDLYALGVMAFVMLSGRHPLADADGSLPAMPTELLGRIVYMTPARIDALASGVPAEIAELIDRLMAKEPAGRPQDADEVAAAFHAAARGERPASAAGPSPGCAGTPRPPGGTRPFTPTPRTDVLRLPPTAPLPVVDERGPAVTASPNRGATRARPSRARTAAFRAWLDVPRLAGLSVLHMLTALLGVSLGGVLIILLLPLFLPARPAARASPSAAAARATAAPSASASASALPEPSIAAPEPTVSAAPPPPSRPVLPLPRPVPAPRPAPPPPPAEPVLPALPY